MRGDHIGLADRRLNHSAKVSYDIPLMGSGTVCGLNLEAAAALAAQGFESLHLAHCPSPKQFASIASPRVQNDLHCPSPTAINGGAIQKPPHDRFNPASRPDSDADLPDSEAELGPLTIIGRSYDTLAGG